VQQAVLKAMEPKRSDRPQTVIEFWQMLVASGGEQETKTIALADQETVPRASARGRRGDLAAEVGLRRLAGPIVRMMNNLRLILLGTGITIVLATALALSLSRPPTRRASSDVISPGATTLASPTETATELVITPSPVAVATRAEGFVSQTEVVPLIPSLLVAATGTADARLMATQHAIDLTTTRQAAKFLDCDKLEYQVLQPLIDVQTVAFAVANVELTWRVSNKATASGCKWGEKGQETRVLNAALAGGSRNTATPVKLTWIQDDEYDLSLDIQLSPGSYLLSWRLLLPKTMLPDGPALEARVVVIALTPNPTPTPTRTPCPSIGYACHCRVECVGRECYPVCDECSKVICK
jgi:hypothetical protein